LPIERDRALPPGFRWSSRVLFHSCLPRCTTGRACRLTRFAALRRAGLQRPRSRDLPRILPAGPPSPLAQTDPSRAPAQQGVAADELVGPPSAYLWRSQLNAGTLGGRSMKHRRSGLRIVGRRGHPQVRAPLLCYARWLRHHFEFPIRVPVYLLPGETVFTMHGEHVSASIFLPWDRRVEPYIRIATGDYPELRRERGRDSALAAFLCSLTHEVLHYRQWVETGRSWERGVGAAAVRLVKAYTQTY
jgi:hypothetical protein